MKIGYFPLFMFAGYFPMLMFVAYFPSLMFARCTDLKGYKENTLISKQNELPLKLSHVTEMSISPL